MLAEAEGRHLEELRRIVGLQTELEAKAAELAAANESARSVSAAVAIATGDPSAPTSASTEGTGAGVPEWKLREFEDLKAAVSGMWEGLDVPAEDVTAFLSEVDLLAPFSPKVRWGLDGSTRCSV